MNLQQQSVSTQKENALEVARRNYLERGLISEVDIVADDHYFTCKFDPDTGSWIEGEHFKFEGNAPMNEAQVNQHIKDAKLDTNLISDGYHTFGELYEHRIMLWIVFCQYQQRLYSQDSNDMGVDWAWRTVAHSDGSVWDGWFILGVGTAQGEQMTYHLPMSKWDLCYFAETLTKAPEWDGHSSDDVLTRIAALIK